MNRRDFILRSLKWGGVLTLGTVAYTVLSPLILSTKRQFITNRKLPFKNILFSSNLPITENHFDFAIHRKRTITDKIIIHHSAVSGTDELTAADIHQAHKDNGWAGIGYHFYIHKNGQIETGRPVEEVGAHTYKYNNSSIGICLAGDFEEEYPTDLQLSSCAKLIAVLCKMYYLLSDEHTVLSHRDFNETACPGENLFEQMPKIRNDAHKFIQQL